jgi:hypothetical protein
VTVTASTLGSVLWAKAADEIARTLAAQSRMRFETVDKMASPIFLKALFVTRLPLRQHCFMLILQEIEMRPRPRQYGKALGLI